MKNLKIVLFISTLLLLFGVQSKAQRFEFPEQIYLDTLSLNTIITTPTPDTIEVDNGLLTTGLGSNVLKSVRNLMQFYVREDAATLSERYDYKITYEWIGYNNLQNSSSTISGGLDTLRINYNPDSLASYKDLDYKHITGCHKVLLIIHDVISIDTNGTQTQITPATIVPSPTVPNSHWSNAYVENTIRLQVFESNYTAVSTIGVTGSYTPKGVVEVYWDTLPGQRKFPSSYELEWTYSDNYMNSSPTANFINNATRVLTNKNKYEIPAIYESGELSYRVRVVRPNPLNYMERTYGAWSTPQKVVLGAYKQDSINWSHTLQFAEEGKYKQVVSISDGLYNNKQTLTKLNTTPNQIVVAKQIYDFEGRPAISLLPIPVLGQYKIDYVNNFAMLNASTEYGPSVFDSLNSLQDTSFCNPTIIPPLDPTSIADKYYSVNNIQNVGVNRYLPNAKGYPFSYSITAPEDKEKVLTVGAAGKELQIGTGREITNVYVTPMQTELNQLFGQDIGHRSFYKKVVTTDQHDQQSFVIKDLSDRTVASGMLGWGPDSTSGLGMTGMKLPGTRTFKTNLLSNNFPYTGAVWTDAGSHYVDFSAPYQFSYGSTYPAYLACPGTNLYLTVPLHYEYHVADQCGDIKLVDSGIVGTTSIVQTSTPFSVDSTAPQQSASLVKGKHIYSKTSFIEEADLFAAADSLINHPASASCIKSEDWFIKQHYLDLELPCPTDTTSPCEGDLFWAMSEMWPRQKYGQYQYTDSINYTFNGVIQNSILDTIRVVNDSTQYPGLGKVKGWSYSHTGDLVSIWGGHMQGEYDSITFYRYQLPCIIYPDTVWANGIAYTNLHAMPVNTFIDIFNDDIARALLVLHPDYCRLKLLCDILEKGNYEDHLLSAGNSANADRIGLLDLNTIASADPLSNHLALDTLKILKGSTDYLDSLALVQTVCGNSVNGQLSDACREFYFAGASIPTVGDLNNTEKDVYYANLVQQYIANRNARLYALIYDTTINCGPCEIYRLNLIGASLFDSLANVDSIFNNDPDSLISSMANLGNVDTTNWGSTNNNISQLIGGNPGGLTPAAVSSNIQNFSNGPIYAECSGVVDEIMEDLENCSLDTLVLQEVRDSLLARICNSSGYSQFLKHDILLSVLNDVGVNRNDLCNEYLVDWSKIILSKQRPLKQERFPMAASYFSDMAAFLSKDDIVGIIRQGSSSSMTNINSTSSTAFQSQLASTLGYGTGASSTQTATWINASQGVQHLFIERNGASTGKDVQFTIAAAMPTEDNRLTSALSSNAFDEFVIDSIYSIYHLFGNDSWVNSRINSNTAILSVRGINYPTDTTWQYYALTYMGATMDVPFIEEDVHEQLNGLTCKEFTTALPQIINEAANDNIYINHPNAASYIKSRINDKYDINFSGLDYINFIESCAMSDSLSIPAAKSHFEIVFPPVGQLSDVQTFTDSLKNRWGVFVLAAKVYEENGQLHLQVQYSTSYNSNFAKVQADVEGVRNNVCNSCTSNYMHRLSSDTLAQLVVSTQYDSINVAGILLAVPGATINSVPGITYFGQNYGFQSAATVYTITKSGLSDYEKSHMTNDLVNYVIEKGPLTHTMLAYSPSVAIDYSRASNTNWRNYIKGLNETDHTPLVKKHKPDSLGTYITAFNSYGITYRDPLELSMRNHLYLNDNAANPDFNYIESVINTMTSLVPGNTAFYQVPNVPLLGSLGMTNTETRTYRCGDTSLFLINHFDSQDKMFNIFIRVPDFIMGVPADYALDSIKIGYGDTSIYRMKMFMTNNQVSPAHHIEANAFADFTLGTSQKIANAILSSNEYEQVSYFNYDNCERSKITNMIPGAKQAYQYYVDSVRYAVAGNIRQHIMSTLTEKLEIEGSDLNYHHTLYYYDLAGNLHKTVPPAGVDKLDNRISLNDSINLFRSGDLLPAVTPQHVKETTYEYNSFNKVTNQYTPDGGMTEFFYDQAGRLVFSQNEKQRPHNHYSYTMYDGQSRIVETGELTTSLILDLDLINGNDDIINFVQSQNRTQVVSTTYDEATSLAITNTTLPQQMNLRKRVSAIKYIPILPPNAVGKSALNYESTIMYSYDILGNVHTMIYDLIGIIEEGQRFKRVDYEYDLLSGKVNMVTYNRGFADQYYQKYGYDADNRITEVETSNDGIMWEKDAHYTYYPHGPLAGVQLGNQNIQGVDYAYTINGWLKAINGSDNHHSLDMGADGSANSIIPEDVFSQRIDYFPNDFDAIGDSTLMYDLPQTAKALYNGNISNVVSALKPFTTLVKDYTYDPLNRLVRANYEEVSGTPSGFGSMTAASIPDYASDYKYDFDGNILSLNRMGGPIGMNPAQHMDSLRYFYPAGNNKLYNVTDHETNTAYLPADIPPTTDTSLTRYRYDLIGNLTKDSLTGIDSIHWNLLNKVARVDKDTNNAIIFAYDGTGQRLLKNNESKLTGDTILSQRNIYIRDASGNTLAVYKDSTAYTTQQIITSLTQVITVLNGGGPSGPPLPPAATTLNNAFASVASAVVAAPSSNQLVQTMLASEGALTKLQEYRQVSPMMVEGSETIIQTVASEFPVGEKVAYQLRPSLLQSTLLSGLNNEYLSSQRAHDLLKWNKALFPEQFELLCGERGIAFTPESNDDINQFITNIEEEGLEFSEPLANDMYNDIAEHPDNVAYYDSLAAYPAYNYTGGAPSTDHYRKMYEVFTQAVFYGETEEVTTVEFATALHTKPSVANHINYIDMSRVEDVAAQVQTFILNDPSTFYSIVQSTNSNQLVSNALLSSPLGINAVATALTTVVATTPALQVQNIQIAHDRRYGLSEHHYYGSSRLGVKTYPSGYLGFRLTQQNQNAQLSASAIATAYPWYNDDLNELISPTKLDDSIKNTDFEMGMWKYVHNMAFKNYELTNHLGNVQATIQDRVSMAQSGNLATRTFAANISSATDHYPFGMQMPGRDVSAAQYRFGFNGQEKDNEVKGIGNSLDFGARIYDSRLGKFLSIDPKRAELPAYSPYGYAINNPIVFVDKDGEYPGVTFFFFEFDIGLGLGFGLNHVEQTGLAYDEVGKTHFTMRSTLYIANQTPGKEREGEIIAGASVGLTANWKQSWAKETFAGLINHNGQTGTGIGGLDGGVIGAVNLGFGDQEFTLGLGVGMGLKISATNPTIVQSISLTDKEADKVSDATDVWTESWDLGSIAETTDKKGNVTGYSATVTTKNTKGETINTGVKVQSGVKKDKNGNAEPSGIWMSSNYKTQSTKAEQ